MAPPAAPSEDARPSSRPRVALAHDFIRHGGAEKVLDELHRIWPEAPVYTLLAEDHPHRRDWDIRPSFLQRFVPPRRYRWPTPIYPFLVDRLRIREPVDLVVSCSVSWMKSLAPPPGSLHLCYLCRPMMFGYERQDVFLATYPRPARPFLRLLANSIRRWDQARTDRPHLYVALSRYIADRVRDLYRREAVVVFPPVETARFQEAAVATPPGDYFLTALRLESYKRVDIVVEACTRLGLPLKVAGRGPEEKRLREIAGPTVEFLGFVPDEELPRLYAGCRAFLFPAEEDFGIAPVEALAAGRPVIAYGAGGCLETVEDGVTGLHFPEQSASSLMDALRRFEGLDFPAGRLQAAARRFRPERFREEMARIAAELLTQGPPPPPRGPRARG